MALQTQVNAMPALGLPGQEVSVGTAVYTPVNYLSDGTAVAGGFVFDVTADVTGGNAAAGAVSFNYAGAQKAGAKVLGLVVRNITGAFDIVDGDDHNDSANVYKRGAPLGVARQGDFYHVATGAASVGHSVECDPSDGSVTYAASAGDKATGWYVMTAAKSAGDIIVISNRGATH